MNREPEKVYCAESYGCGICDSRRRRRHIWDRENAPCAPIEWTGRLSYTLGYNVSDDMRSLLNHSGVNPDRINAPFPDKLVREKPEVIDRMLNEAATAARRITELKSYVGHANKERDTLRNSLIAMGRYRDEAIRARDIANERINDLKAQLKKLSEYHLNEKSRREVAEANVTGLARRLDSTIAKLEEVEIKCLQSPGASYGALLKENAGLRESAHEYRVRADRAEAKLRKITNITG